MSVDLAAIRRAVVLLMDHERRRMRRAEHQGQVTGNAAQAERAEREIAEWSALLERIEAAATPEHELTPAIVQALDRLTWGEMRRLLRLYERAQERDQSRIRDTAQAEIDALKQARRALGLHVPESRY